MISKSNSLFITILTICIFAGCQLEKPIDVGSHCEGITQENVIHTTSDACMKNSPSTCAEEDHTAIDMGYCPAGFTCIDNHGVVQCKHGCESNKAMCNGECVNPLFSITNCGAKPGGTCSDSSSQSNNYEGVNCNDIKSDSRMVCNNGKCVETTCNADEHLVPNKDGTTTCAPNSNEACGSIDVQCKPTEVCKAGVCSESCGVTQVACDGECIDPMTSREFCGAKEGCVNFEICTDGKVCSNGECRILDCPSSNEMRCTGDEGEKCIDVKSNPLNCGNCNFDCHHLTNSHTQLKEAACVDGQCRFECTSEEGIDYVNCGTDTNPDCVNLNNDSRHCGSCGKQCDGYCDNGSCMSSACTGENLCARNNCENSATLCGKQCINCLDDEFHTVGASCDNGECHITECKTGYYLYNNTCEKNSTENCNAHGARCNASNATGYKCDDILGCQVTGCKTGYHKSANGNSCNTNTNYACASDTNDCTKITSNGWQKGKCDTTAGKCIADTCKSGYNKVDNYCIRSCFPATYYNTTYCCPSVSDQSSCNNTNYHNCSSCYQVSFSKQNNYDTSYYESCVNTILGSYQYSSIYCPHGHCEGWISGSYKPKTIGELMNSSPSPGGPGYYACIYHY